eukprot:180921-Rhodomonas_salina.1
MQHHYSQTSCCIADSRCFAKAGVLVGQPSRPLLVRSHPEHARETPVSQARMLLGGSRLRQ